MNSAKKQRRKIRYHIFNQKKKSIEKLKILIKFIRQNFKILKKPINI